MSEKVPGLAGMHPEQRNAFLRQLRFLKGAAGLTPGRVGNNTLKWMQGFFGATTALSAYEMLRASLDAMDQSHLHVQALLNAYGGEGLADDLKDRRRNFAEKHGLKESRVFHLEDLALDEMLNNLNALAQGKEIKSPKLKAVEPSNKESSVEEPTVKNLLIGLTKAVEEQTAVLREISAKLDRK